MAGHFWSVVWKPRTEIFLGHAFKCETYQPYISEFQAHRAIVS